MASAAWTTFTKAAFKVGAAKTVIGKGAVAAVSTGSVVGGVYVASETNKDTNNSSGGWKAHATVAASAVARAAPNDCPFSSSSLPRSETLVTTTSTPSSTPSSTHSSSSSSSPFLALSSSPVRASGEVKLRPVLPSIMENLRNPDSPLSEFLASVHKHQPQQPPKDPLNRGEEKVKVPAGWRPPTAWDLIDNASRYGQGGLAARFVASSRTRTLNRLANSTFQVRAMHTSASTAVAASTGVNGVANTSLATSNEMSNGTLKSAARSIPHPDKRDKGGEDAHFLLSSIVGVADGVGGWAEHGVDPAEYSRGLMKAAQSCADDICGKDGTCSPNTILQRAFDEVQKQRIIGSTTACIVSVEAKGDGTLVLHSANLGDSGFMVVRGNVLIHQSQPQTHGFNFPRQLGAESDDQPRDADTEHLSVQPGDWVVLGTDGLFDNLAPGDVHRLVERHSTDGAQQLADAIALEAQKMAENPDALTPFAREARNAGHVWRGGKLDDITVVVAQVQAPSLPPPSPSAAAAATTTRPTGSASTSATSATSSQRTSAAPNTPPSSSSSTRATSSAPR